MPSLSDTSPDWRSYELRELAFVSKTGADCLFREEHPEGMAGGVPAGWMHLLPVAVQSPGADSCLLGRSGCSAGGHLGCARDELGDAPSCTGHLRRKSVPPCLATCPSRAASTTRGQRQSLEHNSLNRKLAFKIIHLDFHPQSLTHPKEGECLSLDDSSVHLAALSKAGSRGYLSEAWGCPIFVLITLKYFIPPPLLGI